MKAIIFFTLAIFSAAGCTNNVNSDLEEYYSKNVLLHQTLADGIFGYVDLTNAKEVRIGKSLDGRNFITFSYTLSNGENSTVVEFDINTLKSTYRNPEYIFEKEIPIEVIKLFKTSKYTSVFGDSAEVFFGYRENRDGNTRRGIVIDKNAGRERSRYLQKLAERVYIVNGVIL